MKFLKNLKFNSQNQIVVIILSLMHLLCDFICAFKVVGILGNEFIEYSLIIFILYNTLAFCFQPIVGLIIDKIHYEKVNLLLTTIFLTLGVVFKNYILSCICLGIANSIFHVAGGKICTNISTDKSIHLGLFVSLGAIGLMIGSNFYNNYYLLIISLVTYILFTIIVWLIYQQETKEEITKINITTSKKIFAVIFLVLIVFIRSFVGKIIHYDFNITINLVVILAVASAFGKFIGGVLKDLFGSIKVIFVTLSLCGIILIFFDNIIILMILATIFINISMPITLFELNKLNPNHEGLNFGLLAAVLFPGVALGLVYPYEIISYIILVIVCMILSIFGIYYVKRIGNNHD